MRLVHDYEIVSFTQRRNRVCAAKPLKRDKVRARLCRRKRVAPHRGQPGWRYDESARKPARDRGSDERLAHADVVAEEHTSELVERHGRSSDGGLLVGPQCDPTYRLARLVFPEQDLRNAGAYDRRRF
jgi:hypothetical protein